MDLSAPGSHVVAGNGGGTGPADPFTQIISDPASETALGAPADPAFDGGNTASIVALLKALLDATGGGGAVAADGSGAVATGGVAQNLFGGAAPPTGYLVQNLSGDFLYLSDVGTAAATGASVMLAPGGGYFETPPSYRPPGPVSLYGATAGQAFAARYW